MAATIAVRATAAAMGPGVGSVIIVTAHNTAVRSTQTKPRSLDADLIDAFRSNMNRLVTLSDARHAIDRVTRDSGKFSRRLP
jgi:hypothetical protein